MERFWAFYYLLTPWQLQAGIKMEGLLMPTCRGNAKNRLPVQVVFLRCFMNIFLYFATRSLCLDLLLKITDKGSGQLTHLTAGFPRHEFMFN